MSDDSPSRRPPDPDRELTFEDVLRWQAMARVVERGLDLDGQAEAEAVPPPRRRAAVVADADPPSGPAGEHRRRETGLESLDDAPGGADAPMDRRHAMTMMVGALLAGTQAMAACANVLPGRSPDPERYRLELQERLKKNFRVMSDEEKQDTIRRLERLAQIKRGIQINLSAEDAAEGVLFGYAFNLSKCKGYRECVAGCVRENNQDRRSGIQFIRIFEMEGGEIDFDDATAEYQHEVPQEGHFYMGTQCFQCANPPCVEVCPVAATWQEPDGIVVIDYDWCIGCRYCIAACPYWARRFNWAEPEIPNDQINPDQHYLGNRLRRKGCVEKCMFCIQRTRQGRMPACLEACPTGARIFGNLLDPNSEIRWILEHKRVFRLKEELGTEPRFWYYMD